MNSLLIFLVNLVNCLFMVGMMQSTYLRSTTHVRVTVALLTVALFYNAIFNLYSALALHDHGSQAELFLSLAILARFVSNALSSGVPLSRFRR